MYARSSWLGLLLLGLTGCDVEVLNMYTCSAPDVDHIGPDGQPIDTTHHEDPHELSCTIGQFSHWPYEWGSPSWAWMGPEDQAPACPEGVISVSYEGHADSVAPVLGEVCTCDPPTGSCALPSTISASTTACDTPGGAKTSFNAPSPWDGSCDGTTQAPGGSARSLTVDPIVMTENGCASGTPIPARVAPRHWNKFARMCDIGLSPGSIERSACLTAAPTAAGFKTWHSLRRD